MSHEAVSETTGHFGSAEIQQWPLTTLSAKPLCCMLYLCMPLRLQFELVVISLAQTLCTRVEVNYIRTDLL